MICDWDIQTFDYWVEVLEHERKNPKLPKSGLKVSSLQPCASILTLTFYADARFVPLLGRTTLRRHLVGSPRPRLPPALHPSRPSRQHQRESSRLHEADTMGGSLPRSIDKRPAVPPLPPRKGSLARSASDQSEFATRSWIREGAHGRRKHLEIPWSTGG